MSSNDTLAPCRRSQQRCRDRLSTAVPRLAQAVKMWKRQPDGFHHRPLPMAFTVVELLVVIAIIGLLVALIIPAVQSSREAARQAHCKSNLHQIGLALQGYQARKQVFPVGCIECDWRLPPPHKQIAWNVALLPGLEQQAIYDQFSYSHAFRSEENRLAAGQVIPTFLCPSADGTQRSGSTTGDRNENGVWDPGDDLAYTDYGGMFGVSHDGEIKTKHQGVMVYEKPVAPTAIRDGLSRTVVVAECAGRGEGFQSEWANGQNLFDQQHGNGINTTRNNEIWSDHPGGAMVLFCDAHVQFLDETIDQEVLEAMLTRAGGETIGFGD